MGWSGRCRRNRIGTVLLLVALAIPTVGVSPAHALPPTVGAFVPLSGAPGTSVTIAGILPTPPRRLERRKEPTWPVGQLCWPTGHVPVLDRSRY
jgi:hypothetical protein